MSTSNDTVINVVNDNTQYEYWTKQLPNLLVKAGPTSSMITNRESTEGTDYSFKVVVRRNPGVSYVEDGAAYPNAGQQTYATAKIYMRYLAAKLPVTLGVAYGITGQGASVVDEPSFELEGLVDTAMKLENWMVFGNGTGKVATVKSGSSSTTLIVDDGRMILPGGSYDIYDGSTFVETVSVSNIDLAPTNNGWATVTLTAAPASSMVSGYSVIWGGSYNRAPAGLFSMIDNTPTTFQNINVSTYKNYSSLVLAPYSSTSPGALTSSLFRKMMAGLRNKNGNDFTVSPTLVSCFSMMSNMEEMYENALRIDTSTTVNGVEIQSFKSALGTVNLMADADAPFNTLFCVDFGDLAVRQFKDFGPVDGGPLFLRSVDQLKYTANLLGMKQNYIQRRTTSARIDNIAIDPVQQG